MKILTFLPWVLLIFLNAHAQETAIDVAFKKAKIKSADSMDLRVAKILELINDQHYFQPSGPPPDLSPPFDLPYHLDSMRNAEEILLQKVGGGCGSAAIVFASLLEKSGIPDENIRIVSSVVNEDYNSICPTQEKPRIKRPRVGASGHVYVMVKQADGSWTMFNTTESGRDYSRVTVPSPEILAQKMKTAPEPIPYDSTKSLLKDPEPLKIFWSGQTIFNISKPSELPKHSFEERLNLIASGTISGKHCRYSKLEVPTKTEETPPH